MPQVKRKNKENEAEEEWLFIVKDQILYTYRDSLSSFNELTLISDKKGFSFNG
jgi:hypothetical protein